MRLAFIAAAAIAATSAAHGQELDHQTCIEELAHTYEMAAGSVQVSIERRDFMQRYMPRDSEARAAAVAFPETIRAEWLAHIERLSDICESLRD